MDGVGIGLVYTSTTPFGVGFSGGFILFYFIYLFNS